MESDINVVLDEKPNLKDEGEMGLLQPIQSQPCRFCSASFSSEVELILHFHQEHFITENKHKQRTGLPTSLSSAVLSAGDEDDDEFESDLDFDSNQDHESQEEAEDKRMTSLDFLTECEELLLQNPVLDPSFTEDEESNREPEEDGVQGFLKGPFPGENYDLSGTGTKTEVPVKSSSGACDKGRQKRTLGLLRLLKKSPEDKISSSSSRSPNKPLERNRLEKANRFECLFCGKSFEKESLLCAHIRGEHIKEAPFFCKLCDLCFSRTNYLTRHMKRCHVDATPYKCKSCLDSFSILSQLKTHMRTHLDDSRMFGCDYCNSSFSRKDNLIQHLSCHPGAKPLKCDICGKGFIIPGRLLQHINRIHSPMNPMDENWKCSICDKEFKLNCSLQDHMISHTKKKGFECEHCGKRLSRNRDKLRHIRTFHGG